jgi:hypothetical protein
VNSNDPENPVIKIPTTLTINASPVITFSQNEVVFDTAFVGETVLFSQLLTNSGSDTLVLTDLTINGDQEFSVHHELPDTIVPGQSKELIIQFEPTEIKNYQANLSVGSNDLTKPTATLQISGYAQASSILGLSSEMMTDTLSLDLSSKDYTLTLSNTGTENLSVRMMIEPATPFYQLVRGLEQIKTSSGVYEGVLVRSDHPESNETDEVLTDPNEIAGYATSTGFGRVLILAAANDARIKHVVEEIQATNTFSFIGYINSKYSTPSYELLKGYDAVLIWADGHHRNPTALGNALANYVDNGGGVVTAMYQNTNHYPLGGKW